jgi:beta-lactamase superfamily II metal-dependent hydrolase
VAEAQQIRRVSVEFLRPGRSHNQLLSPYTHYLAVCNDAGAGVVTVPYEHRVFERRLKELRYETGDQSDRLEMLHEVGTDMGRILEAVPGLTGALANSDQPGTLVHLRLTLSAAELALLPFELAQVPVGSSGSALSIQARPPVSVTRHIRTVSSEGVVWPHRPRILFIAGDPDAIPFEAHRDTLVAATDPFRYPNRDERAVSAEGNREQVGDLLTILVNPTLAELQHECSHTAYTHVHILTHGDLDALSQESYGLVMRDDDGAPDIVSGARFVSAITRVGHHPTVVTIASCDSGNVGSVVIPGASFAHAVHQAGIPFVVGAQFPLSIDGSVPLARTLYNGLLWGEHPLRVVQRARAELHARYNTNWHDWASVVVYEALPPALDDQLEALQYFQAKRAMNAALERIDTAVKQTSEGGPSESVEKLETAVTTALQRLPRDGQYAVECTGLCASAYKRLAQTAFTRARHVPDSAALRGWDPYDLLDQARREYGRAVTGLLVNDARARQRLATLHWVTVQHVSLSVVLEGTSEPGEWEAAKLCADRYCDHDVMEERAWAHGSLAELWLLRLAGPNASSAERAEWAANAVRDAQTLSRFYPGIDEFPVKSTRLQFERYVSWWGDQEFAEGLGRRGFPRRVSWSGEHGVIETANTLVRILARRPSSGGRGPAAAPAAPAPPAGRPVVPGVPIDHAAPPAAPAAPASSGGTSAAGLGPPRSTTSSGSALSRPPRVRAAAAMQPRRGAPFFDIEVLPAGHGDCLWIEYGDRAATHRWLIDCGTQATARALRRRVDAVPENQRVLELFLMSHIDSDHIGGALPFFTAVQDGLRLGDVWFNGWRHVSGHLGARQGEMFSTAIQDLDLPWNEWRAGETIVLAGDELPVHALPGGMTLTLLSPTPAQLTKLRPVWVRELKKYGLEPGGRVDYRRFLKGTPSTSTDVDELADAPFTGDKGAPNGSSIAVLAEFGGARALFAADAHAPVLVESIRKLLRTRGGERLKLDGFKVSHHASQNNVSTELLGLLDCRRYIVSTNGDHFNHPDREAIGRLIKYGGERPALYFNYRSRSTEVWARDDLQERYGYSAHYPEPERPGITVPLLAA